MLYYMLRYAHNNLMNILLTYMPTYDNCGCVDTELTTENILITPPPRLHCRLNHASHQVQSNPTSWWDGQIIRVSFDMQLPEAVHTVAALVEWVRALAWTGDRVVLAGFESRCGNFVSALWQFRLPRFASVFRRRH